MTTNHYQLLTEAYLMATPAGAYQATRGPAEGAASRLVLALMRERQASLATCERLCRWCGLADEQQALGLLAGLHQRQLVMGALEPVAAPRGTLEKVLPPYLAQLSSDGRAMLADEQGLYLAAHGFSHETAEELAALSAEIMTMQERRRQLLNKHLQLRSDAWGIVDASGNSQIGFWPIHLEQGRYTLVLAQLPMLHRIAFRDLVWTMSCWQTT